MATTTNIICKIIFATLFFLPCFGIAESETAFDKALKKWGENMEIAEAVYNMVEIESLTVAKTIWGEARNQDHETRVAVASVIYNRVKERKMPAVDVCRQPKQFSCWNSGEVRVVIVSHRDSEIWEDCKRIARSIYYADFAPNTTANHFYARSIKKRPYWARDAKMWQYIGDFVFIKI